MRRHKGSDGWGRDSYNIPTYAVAGSSDCGSWSDSPAPTAKVLAELQRVIDHLKSEGIKAAFWMRGGGVGATQSGNLFMAKRWVVVPRGQFKRGKRLAEAWIEETKLDTHWIHDAT